MTATLEPFAGPVTADEIRRRVDRVPRVPLALTPTPLQEAPRLAKELGIGRLLIRRPLGMDLALCNTQQC